MSRTTRHGIEWKVLAGGVHYARAEYDALVDGWFYSHKGSNWEHSPYRGWTSAGFYTSDCRDGKGHNGVMGSAPRWYKEIRRRKERRIVRECLYHGKDIPSVKKSDDWYW